MVGLGDPIVPLGCPFGSNPGPDWLVLAFGRVRHSLPCSAALRLETRAEPGLLRVRLVPLNHLRIPIHTIRHAGRPTTLFATGGWGLRWSGKGRALNAYGSRGVQLILDDGSRILWALSGPDELLIALHAAGYA